MKAWQEGIGSYIRHTLNDLDPNDLETCARRLETIDIKGLLSRCLNEDSTDILAHMADDSYEHANGFDKISFPALAGTPLRLRLHIWRGSLPGREQKVPLPDAHNHRWPLASRILAGTLRNDIYVAEDRTNGQYAHYVHHQTGSVRGYRFTYLGPTELKQAEAIITSVGELYTLAPDIIHRAQPNQGIYTVTAALELAPVRKATDVFAESVGKPADIELDPPRFPVDLLREKLIAVYRDC